MPETSSLYNARLLAKVLKAHGCKHLVVSPGSRNAPLIYACTAEQFETYSVPDERSAAFTAMGMALEKGEPAAVICTSGSAAANFLPAVTEAYFQKVPLIVITADRPKEWQNQGAGQTIIQEGIYGKHILGEANLIREPQDELSKAYNLRICQEALLHINKGPVHINVPFDEPLYDKYQGPEESFRIIKRPSTKRFLAEEDFNQLKDIFHNAQRPAILVGQMPPRPRLHSALKKLMEKSPFLLLSETLSNLADLPGIHSIDRFLNTLNKEEKAQFKPDLLISLGGEVVSKMIKVHFQQSEPFPQWHFTEDEAFKDTFHKLSLNLDCDATWFFEKLAEEAEGETNSWVDECMSLEIHKRKAHSQYIAEVPYSDFKIFGRILEHLPDHSIFHCANSASIRYAQLFDHKEGILHYANRGTSGIDGSTSTAIGHALTTNKPVTLVSGDIAFMYDNAAFWNDRLPENLKVIVINNSGGNIFRIIKGPDQIEGFERFQETTHNLKLQALAELYGIQYFNAEDDSSTQGALKELYAFKGLAILEIKSPRLESPEALSNYWAYLKS